MRKLLFLVVALVFSAGLSRGFASMVFTTTNGSTFSIATENLVITIDGSKVLAQNATENLEFEASELQMMQFGEYTGLTSVSGENGGAVKLYTLDGMEAGSFASLEEARTSLSGGIYIVKLASGGSLKINFKK